LKVGFELSIELFFWRIDARRDSLRVFQKILKCLFEILSPALPSLGSCTRASSPHHRHLQFHRDWLYWICLNNFDDTCPLRPRFGRRIQSRAELGESGELHGTERGRAFTLASDLLNAFDLRAEGTKRGCPKSDRNLLGRTP